MFDDVPQILRPPRDDLLAGRDDVLHAGDAILVAAVAPPSVELGESNQADVRDVLDVLTGEDSGGHRLTAIALVTCFPVVGDCAAPELRMPTRPIVVMREALVSVCVMTGVPSTLATSVTDELSLAIV